MEFYEEFIGGFDLKWAIDNGWADPARCKVARVESLDLTGVSVAGGDFVQKQLQLAMNKEATKQRVCVIAAEEMEGPTVLFASSVDGAKAYAHYLTNNYGIPSVYVYGTQPDEERYASLRAFKTGAAKILCNCSVVAVGFDFPPTQTLIMARPTRSRSFALQCWGRAARPLPGTVDFPGSTPESRKAAIAQSKKPYFKIVDCTPCANEHTLVTSVDMFAEYDKEVKQRVMAAATNEPLSQEQVAEIAEREAAKIAAAKAIEEMRRNTQGRATGRVVGEDVDITWQSKRSVGTYKNPLRGKYAGVRMSDLPDYYITWGKTNASIPQWIRSVFGREHQRRQGREKGLPVARHA